MTSPATQSARHKVVVIGSGFGGLFGTKALRRADVDVTVIAKTTHHLFQPLLYQVATGILSEGEIAPPTREVLSSQDNASVILGEVTAIDLTAKTVTSQVLGRDTVTSYDSLLVAAGRAELGHLEGAEDPAPELEGVVDRLHAGRELGEVVVAEVGLRRAGRHDERVVRRHGRPTEHLRGDDLLLEVDRGDLAEQQPGVLLAAQDLARGWRDLALGEDAGCDLVEQRLEEVVGRLGDHRHVDRRPAEGLGAEESTEPRPDDDDAVPVLRTLGGCHINIIPSEPPVFQSVSVPWLTLQVSPVERHKGR